MLTSIVRNAAVAIALAFAGSALGQTTVTLQQGLNAYVGTTDARIGTFNPDMNFGGNSTMFLAEENQHSFFVRFAIFAAEGGPVPDNAAITSATLSLYKYWGPAATIKASRVKPAWNEMEITWNVAAAGAPWQTAGALGANDVEASADGQGSVGDAVADGCGDVSAPAACWLNIDVTSGLQTFRSGAPNQGWKLAYVSGGVTSEEKEFVSSENTNSGLRPKLTVTYTVCAHGPFGGTPWGVGEIEAENFDCGGEGVGYHDTTSGNQSNSTYRNPESVDVMDMGTGRTIQYFNTSEWMNYTISVPAGTYSLAIHAAHNATPGQYRIEIDGMDVTGNVTVPGTGSWDAYQWVQAPSPITVAEGTHVVRLVSVQQAFRVDKIRLEMTSPPAQCEDPPQRPFTGSAIVIPSGGATFEAENYDCGGQGTAYHDATSGNEFGSTYRTGESVDIWDIPEGGQVVRNFNTGEWMEYTVNVAVAGTYRLGIRAGHNETPGQYRIEVDGNDATGNVTVPGTGSWDIYEWVDSPSAVYLTAGMHVLRLVSVQQAYRVEKLRVIGSVTQPPDALLFWSGHEGSTALTPPGDCYSEGCWQNMTGTDSTTSFAWPPAFWGGMTSRAQLLVDPQNQPPMTSTSVGNYMRNELRAGEGRNGTRGLYSRIDRNGSGTTAPMGSGITQNIFMVQPQNETSDLYVSYWLKYPVDFFEKLRAGDEWRVVFRW